MIFIDLSCLLRSSALDVEVEDQPWPQQQFEHKDGSLTWEAARQDDLEKLAPKVYSL